METENEEEEEADGKENVRKQIEQLPDWIDKQSASQRLCSVVAQTTPGLLHQFNAFDVDEKRQTERITTTLVFLDSAYAGD